jgi:hypothetical protein
MIEHCHHEQKRSHWGGYPHQVHRPGPARPTDGDRWNLLTLVREEVSLVKGRVMVRGCTVRRGVRPERPTTFSPVSPAFPWRVIEAKRDHAQPRCRHAAGPGVHRTTLDAPFACSSKGSTATVFLNTTASVRMAGGTRTDFGAVSRTGRIMDSPSHGQNRYPDYLDTRNPSPIFVIPNAVKNLQIFPVGRKNRFNQRCCLGVAS